MSIGLMGKRQIYESYLNCGGDPCDFATFDPTDHGYFIHSIERLGKTYFEVGINENNSQVLEYKFPAANGTILPHTIVHDSDELFGPCDDYLSFGIGLIPSCTNDCEPVFTWYYNDQVYKKG